MNSRLCLLPRTCLLSGFVFASTAAVAAQPTCPCSANYFMDFYEARLIFESWQSCEFTNDKGRKAAVVYFYATEGGIAAGQFAATGTGTDINYCNNFTSFIEISGGEYKACADDLMAECAVRLNP